MNINKTLILSKQTKAILKIVYGEKRFTKVLLEKIVNEPLNKLYKDCKKAGYAIRFNFVGVDEIKEMSIFKIVKIIDKPDGSADIIIEYDTKILYPVVRKCYEKKRGSKKLVKRFVLESIEYGIKRNKNDK